MAGTMQLPHVYDWAMWPLEQLLYAQRRHDLFRPLRGKILELGAGTGANLYAYGPNACITALEIEPSAASVASERASPNCVRVVVGDGQQLPFAGHSFDYVTTALVFCSLSEPAAALSEIQRVLRPGGRLVQLEHTRTGHVPVDWVLHTAAPAWKCVTGGCHIDRDTAALLHQHGWHLPRHERYAGGLVRVIEALPPCHTRQQTAKNRSEHVC
jgi:ubiquinone/menaquinone biosynthesis C-methylase UbiE